VIEQQRRVHAKTREVYVLLTDACCTLTCKRCRCNFCAWCLEDCGADAHAHVANCWHNLAPSRNLFASEVLWREGRTRLKRERKLLLN
jgi:hypothetical protein